MYDNNGNTQTSVGSSGTTTYSWDFENRLTGVTLPGSGGTASFKFDPFGRRIEKTTSSTTSIYAYDGDNLIEETNASGAATARYQFGLNIDEPLAVLQGTTSSYYQTDGLESVTSLSNSSGANAQSYTYDSFGNLTASSGSLTNRFRSTAREFDTETSLYFYRARYYDPSIGRFISEDSLRFKSGDVNFYAYVGNNPTNAADPLGLCKVIVRYTRGWGWTPFYHAYVVTIDPSGLMTGIRGGPGEGTPNITTPYGPYAAGAGAFPSAVRLRL